MSSVILPTCENCECISTPFRYLKPDELAYINRNRVEIEFKKGESLSLYTCLIYPLSLIFLSIS